MVSPSVVCGRIGPVIVYKRAMAVRRKVWVSSCFRREHNVLWGILEEARRGLGTACKWSWINSKAEFLAQRPAADVIGLATPEEVAGANSGLHSRRHVYGAGTLLRFIKHLEAAHYGVCGR